ncbi:TetR family transcriptional regulator [Rhodococcus sp. D2-41]|uniref:TetR/AcrR family transcriptional regulator n=1 Tax=Speluncibacter jeojiensis TaxID=2710754 RepID=A0A9X4M3F6_9ACTN|nr:TetR/AcrR family transcriptional regulator [Rhodococcus sp. D2-41]MDG3009772.1 TetR family transcriptional regulator [Rhodococcus sp. D2-41]MDG3014523.1 TetR/AcrR family transcriptional regulator [Corynebacteriales bacterium D3-21]
MARWEGNTRARLERAALELFAEQGYDRTTVAQIAKRAGLTERSFYRWFPDKREVLFGGEELEQCFVGAIEAAPEGADPLTMLMAAFGKAPEVIRPREFLRERSAVISANPPLLERELMKLATLSQALISALERRGVEPRTARLATDAGMAILRQTSRRWVSDENADHARLLSDSAADLLAVLTSGAQNDSGDGSGRHG